MAVAARIPGRWKFDPGSAWPEPLDDAARGVDLDEVRVLVSAGKRVFFELEDGNGPIQTEAQS